MTAYLDALGVVCALGRGQADVAQALLAGDDSGVRPTNNWIAGRTVSVAEVATPLVSLPSTSPGFDTRNNQLLWTAAQEVFESLNEAIVKYGRHRIGIVLGTSTTGIDEATAGIREYLTAGQFPPDYHYAQQELSAPAAFLAEALDITGPRYVISTACTSSGRAMQSARRLIRQGMCDAVLCGGVDSLCALTVRGFAALEAVSDRPCNPFSRNRDGINIGEAAAVFLMTRDALCRRTGSATAPIAILGVGASSDAHHISAPHPDGLGAIDAMRKALTDARLAPGEIGYLNLHGTATRHNDAMESLAVHAVFDTGTPCSSTKPMTGHTLGAAGALEAAFCWLLLSEHNPHGCLPPHRWDGEADPDLATLNLVTPEDRLEDIAPRYLMSNSFAFGGSNLSLILGDTP
ncbi:beta-ketoacyl-[acyl-carrier-protein] synthase family protein [Pseudomonas matsuisoli]|uniref:Beta-ketoacyl-[acyl-carrier-protein] synthase II n=1 Tax=Pseudomonas matsuisoli TaxID=1515666 RepID=A0A917PY53_9PSED|nr:beta-ketoacyl-[acyl-carrier-protein] synthase family protein [Pseudomonas matsuisoli]GGJ99100.1 beta-ketoacyl-[acyl-carrier-protein] synthase II [Pseudomonas matsuisoli]